MWYETLQPEVQSLPPVLAQAATTYLQRGKESHEERCECRNGRCISLTYWWAAQEILKRIHYNKFMSPGQLLEWMRRMFASCPPGYALQFHSQATEQRIREVEQDILTTLEEAMKGVSTHG